MILSFLLFCQSNFLAYFIGLIVDSCTKPLIGTVISIVATILIDYNTHLTPCISNCCHTSAFNIDDAYDFLYKCRYMGILVLFDIFQFFLVFMYRFYCSLEKINIKKNLKMHLLYNSSVRIIDQNSLIVKFSTQVNHNKNSTKLYFN